MSSKVRDRMVHGAADMMRRRGVNAMSVRDLAVHTGAPLGSTYHYFPGGKQQLAEEAVRFSGRSIHRLLERALEAGPVEGARAFLTLWREVVVSNDFRAGCPVLAVTIEEPPPGEASSPALIAADEVFRDWESLLVASLTQHGVDPARASTLATLIVAATEGTVAMCRARQSIEPLDAVTRELLALLEAAVG
ncbi:TetR/AcrR family transcriptional regulator [Chondromyces crocatus]|uniref:TetR family transcriptional regulator n=1 Tax=Chondromyces crocatus TaxID=52 RepID=A0A0K1ECV0_CHOCO|nr:helix-turn-helix domain-containing protein [Chondromyces crocatus]AKT38403.1 TetR family transcriptional regulator [Chondromyces crocatus]